MISLLVLLNELDHPRQQQPPPPVVLVDLSAVNDLEITALERLVDQAEEFHLVVRVFPNLDDAIAAYHEQTLPNHPRPTTDPDPGMCHRERCVQVNYWQATFTKRMLALRDGDGMGTTDADPG